MKRKGMFGSAPNYDTPLAPDQERKFSLWSQARGRENDTQDYDLRGAWQANTKQAPNGHLPDTYKKPNHPTFSAESQYSTPDNPGGRWIPDGKGGWVFWASQANARNMPINALANYFRQTEPGNAVVYPMNTNALLDLFKGGKR